MIGRSEEGMSLVEVLASLVLLSIIIVSFLAIFPTVAKQNKSSEEVMDATYIAQKTIESVIQLNKEVDDLSALIDKLEAGVIEDVVDGESIVAEYKVVSQAGEQAVLERDILEQNYKINIYLEPTENNISTVRVEVLQLGSAGKSRAQIETVLWWR